MYGLPNLLRYGAKIFEAPDPISASKGAENLVTNLDVRSSRNDENPIIDEFGNRATFESCFVTSDVELAPLGHQFVLGFDLGKPMMQNCITIAQDHFTGLSYEHTNQNEYLQNFEIYHGNNKDWMQN